MCKKQSKNLRENIAETWKMWQNKNAKKRCSEKKNCQKDSWQENCLDSQTNGTTKNIREDWKGIRDGGKEKNQGKEK